MTIAPPTNGTDRDPTRDTANQRADLVFRGGVIHTLDGQDRVTEALAVRGGRIVAVGSSEAISPLIGPATEVVELAGRAVLPGINDGHIHAMWLGARWPRLLFDGPVEGHEKRLIETEEQRQAALRKAWALMAELGITSYTEPGIGPGEDNGDTGCFGTDVLATYAALAGTPAQTARVTLLRLFGLLDGASNLADFERGLDVPVPASDPHWLGVPGVKIFADGIPPMRNAWLRSPYREGGFGELMTGSGDDHARLGDFVAMIELAHKRNLQVAVHATGDRTIEEFIATVERLGGAGTLRHYVIHGDLISPDQLERLHRTGMGIALQPIIGDLTADWLAAAVTDEMAAAAWPMQLMLHPGLRATLGSDAPVASFDWRKIIASAAAQLQKRGVAVGRAELTRLLRMYTSIAADQDGALAWKGTLEVGKVADLCVLAVDPYAVGAAGLPEVAVERTVVDGRTVFLRNAMGMPA